MKNNHLFTNDTLKNMQLSNKKFYFRVFIISII